MAMPSMLPLVMATSGPHRDVICISQVKANALQLSVAWDCFQRHSCRA